MHGWSKAWWDVQTVSKSCRFSLTTTSPVSTSCNSKRFVIGPLTLRVSARMSFTRTSVRPRKSTADTTGQHHSHWLHWQVSTVHHEMLQQTRQDSITVTGYTDSYQLCIMRCYSRHDRTASQSLATLTGINCASWDATVEADHAHWSSQQYPQVKSLVIIIMEFLMHLLQWP